MVSLFTYSGAIAQPQFAQATLARWRFHETSGTTAIDVADGRDGTYQGGFELGQPGVIGDGAVGLDGTGRILVDDTGSLGGTLTVAAFGDSLVAGNGLVTADTYSVNLETALDDQGIDATVLDFGVSGETTGDALARVDDVIDADPDVVTIVLGSNDATQTLNQGTAEANLRDMIDQVQDAGIEVLLTGTFGFFPDLGVAGRGYATVAERDAFEAIFPTVAADLGVELLDAAGSDKFLGGQRVEIDGTTIVGGVLGDPSLNFDGIHPTAAGVDQIVDRTLLPTIQAGLASEAIGDNLNVAAGSIELWFTPESLDGQQMLVSRNDSAGPTRGDIEILLDGDRVLVGMQDGTSTHTVDSTGSGFQAVVGDASYLVLTFGDDGMRLYLDGDLVDQNDFTGGTTGNIEPLAIGARANGDFAFSGVIDELAFYQEMLSPTDIASLFEAGRKGNELIGTADDDILIGGVDAEMLRGGAGDDTITGGPGDDRLEGNRGLDTLLGGAGTDVLLGKKADDTLDGGPGGDRLEGNGGPDTLLGGPGDDILIGGPGSDRFVIDDLADGIDEVVDFTAGLGGDVLDLGSVVGFSAGDDPNDFVRLTEVDGDTTVAANAEGLGTDFVEVFDLIGVTGLTVDDLVADVNLDLGASMPVV